ncbi:MAG: nickel insertion protein, partial [Lachnospiraceae bacterium]
HGHEHGGEHSHGHEHGGEHSHGHEHGEKCSHEHHHRNLQDVCMIIDRINHQEIRNLAKKIFRIVAEAEAEVHDQPLEQVHFHEVGAIDSIVDIVSAASCICSLGIKEVVVSELYEGKGHVFCQHGKMPVPAPAVLKIAESQGLYLHLCDNDGEMVTPTGAAIAAALKTQDQLPSRYRVLKTGNGAGKKNFAAANILRIMMIEEK